MTTIDTPARTPHIARIGGPGSDRYKITVDGVLIGRVRRGAELATAKVGSGPHLWYATPVGRAEQRTPFTTRRDAVTALLEATAPAEPVADVEPAQPAGDPRDGLAYLIRTSARGLVPRKVRVDCGMCPAGSRDTECKIHGVDVDPGWWRTPAHLREDGDMTHPTPALTPREVVIDSILVRDEAVGRWPS